jgi:hypothetical protein
MSSTTPDNCPHELRPGTTVCLHCRRAARISGDARTRRTLARVGMIGVALVVCAAAAASGLSALQRYRTPADDASGGDAAGNPAPAPAGGAPERVAAAAPAARALTPRSARGRTPLRMSTAFAERDGDVVTVHFDEMMTRTRRPDKFERIVRATLPEIYGAVADSMLASVKVGALVGGDDLITELPVRGIRLTHSSGAALTLWPETRPGRDGPLVVAYRVTTTP